ncbi:hypothetical protein [Rhodococcus sp. BS-15]|uniref:hypothetical protein n=1 Tax=Rhodococcus sp. BS-15 TaxID=1304954 RepID=UPI001F28D8E3|nr:hypothetical protein [Rhodococcus sp. BS-15]
MTASTPDDGAPRIRGARAWIAVGLLAAALATACSSGGTEATDTAAPTTSTAPGSVRTTDRGALAGLPRHRTACRRSGPGPQSGKRPCRRIHSRPAGCGPGSTATDRADLGRSRLPMAIGVNAAVAPGPARDSFAVNRQLISITAPPAADERPSIAGYRITDYTAERAALTIYTTFPDESIAASDTAVLWSGEDWRLLLPEPGDTTVRVRSITEVPAEATPLEKS